MNHEEIKRRFDDLGIKHTFIAKKIGVSNTTISFWFNGKSKIPTKRLEQLKELLDKYES